MMAPWDVFTLLEGGYRIYEGQSPGGDFSNSVGPLVYGLVAIGMHMQRSPSLLAVTISQVMFLVIASALGWAVTWRRLPSPYAAAYVVFVALLAVSVRPLGYAPGITTYAMLYNRDGWLLYSTLLLLVLVPGRASTSTNRAVLGDGLLLGVLLGLLFYDKITFFIAALAAIGLALVLGSLRREPLLAAATAAGFGVVAAAAWLLFRVDTAAYVGDLVQAANVQLASRREHILAHTLVWISPVVLVTAGVSWLLYRMARHREYPLAAIIRLLVGAAYVLGSSALISAGNAGEKSDLPALVVIPLMFIAFLEPRLPRWAGGSMPVPAATSSGRRVLLLGLAALLAGTIVPIAAQDALALGKAAESGGSVSHPPASQVIDAASYRDFVIPAGSQWHTAYRTAYMIPAMVNNGLALLRANVRPGQTLFTFGYSDPFVMALGLAPNTCGPLWWDLNFDFDAQTHPSAQCAIGDATWVLIPRDLPGHPVDNWTTPTMLGMYSGYLSQHYHQVSETSDWVLLRRDS